VKINPGTAWAVVTARGGSKSIPLKNIFPVAGYPLIAYCLRAAKRAGTIDRIICSTDHPKIAETAIKYGAEVIERTMELSQDLTPSVDVMVHLAESLAQSKNGVAEILVLLQPTSIFLKSEHIDAAVHALYENPVAGSSQCVVKVPHQFHAHNQRHMLDDGKDIAFIYEKERERGYSKQTKPEHFTYGNLIVTRARALLEEKNLFERPSIPIVIPLVYAYDLDGPEDVEMAELMIREKIVKLDM